jgi:hypothetical protein
MSWLSQVDLRKHSALMVKGKKPLNKNIGIWEKTPILCSSVTSPALMDPAWNIPLLPHSITTSTIVAQTNETISKDHFSGSRLPGCVNLAPSPLWELVFSFVR